MIFLQVTEKVAQMDLIDVTNYLEQKLITYYV